MPWNYLPFRMSDYKWHLRELAAAPSQKTTNTATPTTYRLLSAVCAAQMRTNRLSGVWRVADQGPNRSLKFAKPHTMWKLHPTWWQTTPTVWTTPTPLLHPQQHNAKWRHECSIERGKKKKKKPLQWARGGARAAFDVKCSFSHCEVHWKVLRAGRT